MRPAAAVCGTYAAYKAHHDRGEEPCPACREANRDYNREYAARKTRESRAQPGRPHVPMPAYETHDDLPCKVGDPVIWFPKQGGPHKVTAAKACAGCPLLQPCRAYALRFDLYGIWGGLNRHERRTIQKARGIDPIPVCSTNRMAAA